jgi:hypothetical protein
MTTWYKTKTSTGEEVAVLVMDDQVLSGLASEMPDYLAWVAEGNTAEEWNPTDETSSPA